MCSAREGIRGKGVQGHELGLGTSLDNVKVYGISLLLLILANNILGNGAVLGVIVMRALLVTLELVRGTPIIQLSDTVDRLLHLPDGFVLLELVQGHLGPWHRAKEMNNVGQMQIRQRQLHHSNKTLEGD